MEARDNMADRVRQYREDGYILVACRLCGREELYPIQYKNYIPQGWECSACKAGLFGLF